MRQLVMRPDTTAPWFWVYDESGEFYDAGLPLEETAPFQELLNSVESRYTCEHLCGEYYEELGFETQEEKDQLIEDAKRLYEAAKRFLSDRYLLEDDPDLSAIYDTPAGKRAELREAYARENNLPWPEQMTA